MNKRQQKIVADNYSDDGPTVVVKEKSLILLEPKLKKDLDQTISTPDKYVSRYQYNTKNIDKYLALCPHCKKPSLSAFERSVVDSAVDYLNGKRIFYHYPAGGENSLPIIIFMAALGVAAYFILNNL